MKRLSLIYIICLLGYSPELFSQYKQIKRRDFFNEEGPIEMTLRTNLRSLIFSTKNPIYQQASISCRFSDSTLIKEQIRVKRRGQYRNQRCYLASLMLDFKNPSSPVLSPLKKLKWVGGCSKSSDDEQLLLKEYLIYRIYNLLTSMSFRVRLIKTGFQDSQQKVKDYAQYSFLIEDIDALAKRNACKEKTGISFHNENTERKQMTLLAIFQYMIGNYDWSVPYYHNIKLLVPENDTMARPYPVPYDFDYTGLVNPPYADPPAEMGIHHITARIYRGFPRTIEEIEASVALFIQNEDKILSIVKNADFLLDRNKKEMLDFLSEFFETIKNKKSLKRTFIDEARSE
jgi:hypothetical protein